MHELSMTDIADRKLKRNIKQNEFIREPKEHAQVQYSD